MGQDGREGWEGVGKKRQVSHCMKISLVMSLLMRCFCSVVGQPDE